ncbi:hypothetical protein GGX14DRAFT_42771 [Mycena pura]|uniref:Uncharacterized protein n=1 Tax=Mycena pura TaxID=153505 RepID=A0AAD6VN19_9AGAR|nr:hypothetical protein GGX14DRAFT_42771 [Mycena pura]
MTTRTWFPEGYSPHPQVFYYPPGPPPLSAATATPNPQPWLPRGQSRKGSASGSSHTGSRGMRSEPASGTRAQTRTNMPDSSYPQAELVDGLDYFKIGDQVRVRRWAVATDSFTDWIVGQIVRPVLLENEDGSQRRSYLVSYENPRTKKRQEKQFSPHYQEITSLESDSDAAPDTLAPRTNIKSNVVFAPIPVETRHGKVVMSRYHSTK